MKVARTRMHHHTCFLVDHHQLIVFINHIDSDFFRFDTRFMTRTVEHQSNQIIRAHLIVALYRFTIDMDESGISMDSLRESGANIVHVSPEHHYPLGTVTTAGRRQELLSWAAEAADRYIIEDDYDCEFRYSTKSIPALQSMDLSHRVIYMNTFSKSLAPAIRISYMVLPRKLMEHYIARANFYSNSASSCEQYALARFIENGSFERHLSRLKKYYRLEGERLLRIIKQSSLIPASCITGGSCGTHLLVYLDTSLTDVETRWAARSKGINLACLSEFCTEIHPEYEHVLVLNYCDLDERTLAETVRRLGNIFIQW